MPVLCVLVEPGREKISVCGRTEVRALVCVDDVEEEIEDKETKCVVVSREVIIREIVDREVVEVKSSKVVEIAPAPALESVSTDCDFVDVIVSRSPCDFTGITTGIVGYASVEVEDVVLEDEEELEVVELVLRVVCLGVYGPYEREVDFELVVVDEELEVVEVVVRLVCLDV